MLLLEFLHIAPLVAIVSYTLYVLFNYLISGKISLVSNIYKKAASLATIGFAGHLFQAPHLHTTEPCVVYVSVVVAVIAAPFVAKRFG